MTDLHVGLEGIKFTLSILLFCGAWAVLKRVRLDYFRQSMFRLRNDLWDRMYAANLLGSAEYQRVRRTINGWIRIAPRMNVAILLLIARVKPTEPGVGIAVPESDIPASEREFIHQIAAQAQHLAWRHLFLFSFPGCLVGWPLWVGLRVLERTHQAFKSVLVDTPHQLEDQPHLDYETGRFVRPGKDKLVSVQ